MSHLSRAIDVLLEKHAMTPADVAKATQIDPAKISRWRSGTQTFIDSHDLEKLSGVLGGEDGLTVLLHAHLLDECSGNESLITIEPRRGGIIHEDKAPYGALPPRVEHAFKILAKHVTTDADLRDLILSLASLFEKGTLEAGPEKPKEKPTKLSPMSHPERKKN